MSKNINQKRMKEIETEARELTEEEKKLYMGNCTSGRAVIKNHVVVSVRVFNFHEAFERNLTKLMAMEPA